MGKFVSPLLGYNNNVRHKNRVFHIQTEDSGINHPHIITHLFMDGGRILKSVKTSYAEHVGTEKMNDTVRQMMKDQHKAMFIALRDGQFDHLLDPNAAKAAAKAPAPEAKPAEPAKAAEEAKSAEEPNPAEPAKAAEEPKPDEEAKPAGAEAVAAAEPVAEAKPVADAKPADADADATVENAPALTVTGEIDAALARVEPVPDTVDDAAARTDVNGAEVAPVEPAPVSSQDGPFRALPSAIPPPSSREKLGIAVPAVPRVATPALGISAARSEPPVAASAPSPAEPRLASPPAGARAVIPREDSQEGKPKKVPSVRDLTLDFDALDGAATAQPERDDAGLYRGNDLPPPPATLFAKKASSGSYQQPSDPPGSRRQDPREEPTSIPPRPATKPPPSRSGRAEARPEPPKGEQRYAPARPAAVFGAPGTRPQPASIFSDELISDKSLDEVILSYLAEDLEPPHRK